MTATLADGYERRFDVDVKAAAASEEWVRQLFGGEFTVEVKHDVVGSRTGNFYIETWSQGRNGGEFRPSGINTSEADYWVFVMRGSVALVARREDIKAIAREAQRAGATKECTNSDCPTRGVVISRNHLIQRLLRLSEERDERLADAAWEESR